jgi:hypothetical protein
MAGPQAPVYVISGVVRTARGRPVADARVYVKRSPVPLPDIAALTDEQGAFAFAVPAAGSYTLACSVEGQATREVTVSVPKDKGRRVAVEFRVED